MLTFLSQGRPIVNTGITLAFVFDAGKTNAKNYMQDPQRTHLPVLPAAWWVLSWSGSIIFEKTIGKFWVRHLNKIFHSGVKQPTVSCEAKTCCDFAHLFYFHEVSVTVFLILSIHSFSIFLMNSIHFISSWPLSSQGWGWGGSKKTNTVSTFTTSFLLAHLPIPLGWGHNTWAPHTKCQLTKSTGYRYEMQIQKLHP